MKKSYSPLFWNWKFWEFLWNGSGYRVVREGPEEVKKKMGERVGTGMVAQNLMEDMSVNGAK